MRHSGAGCISTMRHFGMVVLLLVTFAVPGGAQSPKATSTKTKKRLEAECAALKEKQKQQAQAPSIVSAPPYSVPPIADPSAPGAVIVPAPALPSTPDIALPPACAELEEMEKKKKGANGDAVSDERFAAMARKHPTMVKIFSTMNMTTPGWTLRAGPIVDGGGAAGGGAYRKIFANERSSFDMMAMLSNRTYLLAQAGFTYSLPPETHLDIVAAVRHESFPEEDFYGLGRDALERDHTSYWRQSLDNTGSVIYSPLPTLHVSAIAGLLDVRLLSGRQEPERFPSVQDRFTAADAPGLQMHTWSNFVHIGAGVDLDRTDNPVFPRGGRYRGSFTIYTPIGGDAIGLGTFTRVDIDLRHYQPLPHTQRHVIAARALIGAIHSSTSTIVPFYFLPRLGGGTTLRSYGTSRLTDRNALAFNLEYRWLMTDRIQLIALTDLGDVAPTFSALRPTKFHVSKGFGVRYHIAGTFLAGVDGAHGTEGWTFIARLGQAF